MLRRNPRLIPVLDVMNGQVVHARAGRREDYHPLTSTLVDSCDPAAIARSLLAATGASELYVADLDAIQGKGSNVRSLSAILAATGPARVWLDLGLHPGCVIPYLPNPYQIHFVVGLETCRTPTFALDCLCLTGFRNERSTFSIDLRAGELLGDWQTWKLTSERDALGLARLVVSLGYRRLIVLDLAHVGMATGGGSEEILRAIRTEFTDIELIAGGGVRSWEDIDRLGELGVDAVLVASALHTGAITFPRPDSRVDRR